MHKQVSTKDAGERTAAAPQSQECSRAPLAYHALAVEVALREQGSNEAGLSMAEHARRLAHHGPNMLPALARASGWARLLAQLRSPLIYLLIAAATIALAIGEYSDAAVIVLVLMLNATAGAIQEGRAEKAMAAIRQLATLKARVCREGREATVEALELVPGDVLLLSAGEAVSADARLIEASMLQLSEAVLTGESLPVCKDVLPVPEAAELPDRTSMVYSGTLVLRGRARALVVGTGVNAEIGRIAELTLSRSELQTPMGRRLDAFGKSLLVLSVGLFVAIVAAGLLSGIGTARVLMLAISQTVGLVPEGLPVVMTIALALGMQRMAARGVIVRRLNAVETLGAATVICTDKTGTLTRNEVCVTTLDLLSGAPIEVSGIGYKPEGLLRRGEHSVTVRTDAQLAELCIAASACNDAQLTFVDGVWRGAGDPTEIALLTMARKAGLDLTVLASALPRIAELPFDSLAKLMVTQHGEQLFMKGAPEAVLTYVQRVRRATGSEELTNQDLERVRAAVSQLATRGLRVLAIASARGGSVVSAPEVGSYSWLLLGLVGEQDPPREGVAEAVARCREAGIRTVMITGDHHDTGLAIAKGLGIAQPDDSALGGQEVATLSASQLEERLATVTVFTRVEPAQKLRIVEAFRARGEVVIMTGDGVNDAPALTHADVGVAMGKSGTDVAKEASKVVITDDSFTTIVDGIEQGRVVYANVKRAVLVLLSSSVGEVAVLLGAVLCGLPVPFAAVQILWNNLITEGTITTGLAMEPAEGNEMMRPPVDPREPIVTRAAFFRIAWLSALISCATLSWYRYRLVNGVSVEVASTEAFALLAVCEWFNVLSCRSATRSIFSRHMRSNVWLWAGLLLSVTLQAFVLYLPFLQRIFYTTALSLRQVLALVAVGSSVLWAEEARKALRRVQLLRRSRASSNALTSVAALAH